MFACAVVSGPLSTARVLPVSGSRGEPASVRDPSEQLFVSQAVIKCMTQTARKVPIKMSISRPQISPSLCCRRLKIETLPFSVLMAS